MMHAKAFALAAVVAGSLGGAATAEAAPLSPTPLGTVAEGALVEHTAGGCGPGWHPARTGGCQPNGPGPSWYRRNGIPHGYGYGAGPPGVYRPDYGYYRRPGYY